MPNDRFSAGEHPARPKLRLLSAAVGISVVALGVGADQAHAQDASIPFGFIGVEQIEDVIDVVQLENGDLELTLSSGETVTISAADIRMIGDVIYVSESAATGQGVLLSSVVADGFALTPSLLAGGLGAVGLTTAGLNGEEGVSAPAPTPPPTNSAPVITSSASASNSENSRDAFTVVATDVDGDAITYSLSGADAGLFDINATTGVVTFISAPDFETPGDVGGNNVYDVIVTANDGVNCLTSAPMAQI